MRLSIVPATLGLVLLTANAFAEVDLPDGAGNTIGTGCGSDGTVELVSGEQRWPLADGALVAQPTRDGDEWGLACKQGNGHSTVSTKCYDDGYVVAGRAGEALKLGCYEGEIPAALR